jgi:hypothetical protein
VMGPPRPFAVARAGATLLAMGAVAWCAALLWAPTAVAAGDVERGGGWMASLLYHAAGQVCHQRIERSFVWGAVPFPVCGRCLALYVSGAAGLTAAAWAAWAAGWRLAWPSRPIVGRAARLTPEAGWLLVAVTPAVVLLCVEVAGLDPGTPARALASVPAGGLAGWICGRGLARRA